ncbi:MAG: PadR family transcriptional regulator [Desulfurococcales archaeon]|nr:PadR family transcriptional regulator [Desulfurococcales archaeon]
MNHSETEALKRLKRKMTIETLWIYVIAVLKKRGAQHGYGVKKAIQQEFNFNPATITTYTVLYRMEKEGLIRKDSTNRYHPTEKGLKAFDEAINVLKETIEKLV